MPGSNIERSQLLLGKLPDDFLRLDLPSTATRCPVNTSGYPVQLPAGPHRMTPHYIPAAGQMIQRNKLSITVVEAKLTKNYGLTKMDPYARLRIGHMIFETPTCSNGSKNPQWNKNLTCYLPDGVDAIYVEIYDERAFTADSKIAWQKVKLPTKVLEGETVDDWYPLTGEQGDNKEGLINVVMSLKLVNDTIHQPMMLNTLPNTVFQGQGVPVQAVNQMPTPPLFTELDVKNLKEMFPSMDEGVIVSVLEQNSGHMDRTVSNLLSMQ